MPKPDGRIKARELAAGAVTSRTFSETIQSDNFVEGRSGWRLQRDSGNLEANEGTFRGDVVVSGGSDIQILSGGDLTITGGDINVVNSAGTRLVGINNQGVKIFDTDGTTEKVVLDSDGLEVIGGFVTPISPDRSGDSEVNFALTTTFQTVNSVTFTPPAWVERLYIFVNHSAQMSDANAKNLNIRILDSDASPVFATATFGVAGTGVLSTNATSVGATIQVDAASFPYTLNQQASVNTGTNSSNVFNLSAVAFGIRVP